MVPIGPGRAHASCRGRGRGPSEKSAGVLGWGGGVGQGAVERGDLGQKVEDLIHLEAWQENKISWIHVERESSWVGIRSGTAGTDQACGGGLHSAYHGRSVEGKVRRVGVCEERVHEGVAGQGRVGRAGPGGARNDSYLRQDQSADKVGKSAWCTCVKPKNGVWICRRELCTEGSEPCW